MSERAAQSFRREEIDAVNAMFRAARKGGDLALLLRNPNFQSVEAKFSRMSKATKLDKDRPSRLETVRDLRKGWDE